MADPIKMNVNCPACGKRVDFEVHGPDTVNLNCSSLLVFTHDEVRCRECFSVFVVGIAGAQVQVNFTLIAVPGKQRVAVASEMPKLMPINGGRHS